MESITSFWNYVSSNQYQLKSLRYQKPRTQKVIMSHFEQRLRAYSKGVAFVIVYPKHDYGVHQLIITADGNPKYFKQVEALVEHAPKLKGWQFVAFIQPAQNYDILEAGLDKPYVYKGISVKASELRFMGIEAEGEKFDLFIFVNNLDISPHNADLRYVVFLIVQDILGEKCLFKHIGCVTLDHMPAEEDPTLIPLCELEFFIYYED